MTRHRILFVLHSEVRAGLEEHVLSLLRHLDRSRFELALAAPAKLLAAVDEELAGLSLRVFPVAPVRWSRPGTVYRLWRVLRQCEPDLVHAHLFRATLVAAPLARLAGVRRAVETYHGPELWRSGIAKAGFLPDRIVSRWVDRVIAVSQHAASFLVAEKGIARSKIVVIANGCELADFEPAGDAARRHTRHTLGIPENCPVIGVVGRLDEQKGHRFLFEALPQVLRAFPAARLLVIGDGPLKTRLQQQAEQLRSSEAVVFAGYQAHVAPLIEACDVLALPSLYEGLPLAAIECAAMGKAIVATAVGGVGEVVSDGVNGRLVAPADPDDLAAALSELLGDPATTARLGDAARLHAREHFDIGKQVTATERVYLDLLEEAPA